MAKKRKGGVNKSEEIRQILQANPAMSANEVVSSLAARGLKVTANLVYFLKGKMKGRQGRRKKAQRMVARVAATSNADPVKTILMVRSCAAELGGLKNLKALIDALSE